MTDTFSSTKCGQLIQAQIAKCDKEIESILSLFAVPGTPEYKILEEAMETQLTDKHSRLDIYFKSRALLGK